MSKLLTLVLLFLTVGCTAELGPVFEPYREPVPETPDAGPDASPDAAPVEESPYLVDSPVIPANWQCYTCNNEGRQVYLCGPQAKPEAMGELCGNAAIGVALNPPGADCVGVWLDSESNCLLPGATGVRGLLAMCGPDSDDVGMVCK